MIGRGAFGNFLEAPGPGMESGKLKGTKHMSSETNHNTIAQACPMTLWDALRWALEWLDRDPSMDPDWQAARNNAADYRYQFKSGAVTAASLVEPLDWAISEIEGRTMVESDNSPEFPAMMSRARETLRLARAELGPLA